MLRLRRGLVTLFVRPHRTTLLLRCLRGLLLPLLNNLLLLRLLKRLLESVDLPLKPTERVGK